MSNDNKTLADVQPGGRVRLGDALPPLPKMQRFTNLYGETYAYSAEQMRDYARAALSAQPSPGGQGDEPEIEQIRALVSSILSTVSLGHQTGPYAYASEDFGRYLSEAAGDCRKIMRLLSDLAARQPVRIYGCCAQPEGELHTAECPNMRHLAARQPVRIYGCCAQPEGELHTAECPNMRHLAARQPVGQENPLMPYVDSYRRMAKIGSGRVSCTAVADDIERNMAPHAAPPAQAVELGAMPHGIRLVEIPHRNGLDPINVFVQDYELGRGRIVVTCYGQAWCGFWGAMGDRTVMQFVAACNADYVAGNMLSGRHEYVKKHERSYVERIATEVIAEFRAMIDSQAVGK